MGLIETLAVGSYIYTTAVFVWFSRKLDAVVTNHLKHLVKKAVEEAVSKMDVRA